MRSHFSGIWVPVVTPFTHEGAVDARALASLVGSLVQAGVHGLVACATTGEAATLNEDEKALVLRTVLEAGAGAPVIMGVSGVSPFDVAQQCRHWRPFGMAGLLVPPPHYVRPSQQGLIQFYQHIASAAAPLPIVVYDIPYRTGALLELATLRALAVIPGICAVKDCGGDARKTQSLIADGQLDMLAGEDAQIFTTLCQGGRGAIAASAHLHPRRFVAMFDAIIAGSWHEARAHHHALAPLVHALFAEPSPGPLKAVLAALGQIGATLRAPMTPASETAARAALAACAAVGPAARLDVQT